MAGTLGVIAKASAVLLLAADDAVFDALDMTLDERDVVCADVTAIAETATGKRERSVMRHQIPH